MGNKSFTNTLNMSYKPAPQLLFTLLKHHTNFVFLALYFISNDDS